MKTLRLLTLVCALGAGWQIQAQTDSSKTITPAKKWQREIGLNVYSMNIRSGDFYSNYKTIYDHYAASGISLKFFHNKSAIRSSVDYLQKIVVDAPRFINDRAISFKTLQFSAGYQRHFSNKKIMPYVFTDLSCSFGRELSQRYHNEPIYFLPYYPYNKNPVTIKTRTFSAIPGIGLRLRLGKNIILNLETAAEFFYQKEFGADSYGVHELTGINLKPMKCTFGFTF